jgi:hypothetical protein
MLLDAPLEPLDWAEDWTVPDEFCELWFDCAELPED